MSTPPKTVLSASPDEEAAIRAAVRAAAGLLVAGPEHVAGLLALFLDPAVSYQRPQPLTCVAHSREAMEVICSGMAMSLFQASQQASTMAS